MNYSDGYRNMFCAYFNVKLPLISKEIVISKYGKNVNVEVIVMSYEWVITPNGEC